MSPLGVATFIRHFLLDRLNISDHWCLSVVCVLVRCISNILIATRHIHIHTRTFTMYTQT